MSNAVELREQALAKLSAARDLTDPTTGEPKAEDQEQFNALMGEFGDLDKQRQDAERTEGNVTSAQEAWQHYTGKLTGQPMQFASVQIDPNARKSPGQQFIDSAEYKELASAPNLLTPGARINMSPVVVGQRRTVQAAATDVIQTGTGGSEVVQRFRQPGIQELGQRPLTVRDLFANEDMPSGDTIEYVAQVGFDTAASAVAQAADAEGVDAATGLKPQSSIALEERTARATWIATWMATTRQALSDVPQLRALIDNQGQLMIRLEEEEQFINGSGVAPDLIGLLDDQNTGLQTLDLTLTGNGLANLEGVRTARRMVRTGTSRMPPTFVIVHPIDSEEFDFLKDAEERYRAGDPFAAGGPDSPPIWRLPRVESEALAEGTGLVGARAGATIFDREPLTIRVAEQHADFFVRNLAVILFEERVAFPIYFPTAFVEITFDAWEAP